MSQSAKKDLEISDLSVDETISNEMMDLLLQADPNRSMVESYLPGTKTLIAYQQKHVVGIAVLVESDGAFELKNIAVKESHQGLGIAKQLIGEIKIAAKNLGAVQLFVGTGNSSLSQLALYQKCGFRFHSIKTAFFAEYDPPIIENGIHCIDMLMLVVDL